MSDSKALRGIFCPLTTPFNHRGELYPAKIRSNVARLARTTLSGYVVGDEPGEGFRLTAAEREQLFSLSSEAAGGEKTLIAAVSADSNAESLQLACAAQRSGYGFVAARPVRGAGSNAEALQSLYFRTLADRSPLPVLVCGADGLSAATAQALAGHPNVAAIGLDGGSVDALAGLLAAGVTTLWGSEASLSAAWRAGARGFILPLANAVPFYLLCIEEALRTRDDAAADELTSRAAVAFERAYGELGVAGLKRALDLRGGYGGVPRLPETPISPAEATAIEAMLDGLAS